MEIRKGRQVKPRRVLVYGDNGVGKSTFAASWPRPIFLNLEDGVNDLEVDSTPRLTTLEAVHGAMSFLIQNENSYETVVIDTLDWMEKLIFTHVASEYGRRSGKQNITCIEEIGFGKGYEMVEHNWRRIINGLSMLWDRGLHIVMTCHSKIAKYKPPEGESYDYHSPALHDKGSEIMCQWCDEVLFARYKVHTRFIDEGFGSKRNIAVGGTDRVILTQEAATHIAKNRLGLPVEIPADFEVIREAMGGLRGLVNNGSSKRKVPANG